MIADEQRVCRAWGGWQVAEILIDPDTKSAAPIGGRSHFAALGDESHWLDYDAKGLRVGHLGEPPVLTVKWSALRAHARQVGTPELRERLRANRVEAREHQRSFPRFAASAAAAGCGRTVTIGPITQAQALYLEEYDRHHKDVFVPYCIDGRRIEAELDALLDECFPLAVDHEPVDLLELLALQESA